MPQFVPQLKEDRVCHLLQTINRISLQEPSHPTLSRAPEARTDSGRIRRVCSCSCLSSNPAQNSVPCVRQRLCLYFTVQGGHLCYGRLVSCLLGTEDRLGALAPAVSQAASYPDNPCTIVTQFGVSSLAPTVSSSKTPLGCLQTTS